MQCGVRGGQLHRPQCKAKATERLRQSVSETGLDIRNEVVSNMDRLGERRATEVRAYASDYHPNVSLPRTVHHLCLKVRFDSGAYKARSYAIVTLIDRHLMAGPVQ